MDNYLNNVYLKLKEIQKNAYAPYSNFRVAAICKVNNEFFYGVNIEISSFPVGICGERSAISAAISKGNKSIDELYLLTDAKEFGTPCGMCRQFMSDFMPNDDQKIYVFNTNGEHKVYTIKELLPDRFTKKDLVNAETISELEKQPNENTLKQESISENENEQK